MQVVSSTPEKIDEFLVEESKLTKKTAKRSLIAIGLSYVAGAIGSCFVKAADMTKFEKARLGGMFGFIAGLCIAGFGYIIDDAKGRKLKQDFIDKNS